MNAKMRQVAIGDATDEELLKFATEGAGLQVKPRAKREELIDFLKTAGHTHWITIVEAAPTLMPATQGPADTDEFDPENERWAEVNFQLAAGQNKRIPVFVSVNEDHAYLPRGVRIVIRERFYRTIVECKETHYAQNASDEGAMKRWSDSERQEVERYPLTFLGWRGYVKDGPPEAGPNVHVIGPGGMSEARAAARTQQAVRERAAA